MTTHEGGGQPQTYVLGALHLDRLQPEPKCGAHGVCAAGTETSPQALHPALPTAPSAFPGGKKLCAGGVYPRGGGCGD